MTKRMDRFLLVAASAVMFATVPAAIANTAVTSLSTPATINQATVEKLNIAAAIAPQQTYVVEGQDNVAPVPQQDLTDATSGAFDLSTNNVTNASTPAADKTATVEMSIA